MKIRFLWAFCLFVLSSPLFSEEMINQKENPLLYGPIKKGKIEVKKDLLLLLENCPKTLKEVKKKEAINIDTFLEKDNCTRERTGQVDKRSSLGIIELIIYIYGHGNTYSLYLENCPDIKQEAEQLPRYLFSDFPVVYQIKLACKNAVKILNKKREETITNPANTILQNKKDSSL